MNTIAKRRSNVFRKDWQVEKTTKKLYKEQKSRWAEENAKFLIHRNKNAKLKDILASY